MHCGHCGEEATQRCGLCRDTHYCSLECQQADWRHHKLVCRQWADFQDRPDKNTRRVILLPADGDRPVFSWMPIEYRLLDGSTVDVTAKDTYEFVDGFAKGARLDCEEVLGDVVCRFTALINKHVGSGKLLRPSIYIGHRDYFQDCSPNQCLASLVGTAVAARWRGPLVIAAAGRSDIDGPDNVLDIDTSSFTLALHRIATYHSGKDVPIKKTVGLKLSAMAPFIQEVEVSHKHPVFKSGSPLSITKVFNWPVNAYNYPTAADTTASPASSSAGGDDPSALNTALLRINIDTTSPDFGKVPASFHEDSATVLLAATNKVHYSLHTLRPFLDFLETHIVADLAEVPANVEAREDMIESLRDQYDFSALLGWWIGAREGFGYGAH